MHRWNLIVFKSNLAAIPKICIEYVYISSAN